MDVYEVINKNVIFSHLKDRAPMTKEQRHWWVTFICNWILVLCAVALIISCIWWGITVRKEKREQAIYAEALAIFQAEQNAAEEERLRLIAEEEATYENMVKKQANAMAKMFYGIRNFEEKYAYSKIDYRTYARCVFNRVDSGAYSGDILEVINQKNQWVGYSDSNPVVNNYYNMAYEFINEWYTENTKPITNDYLWAELTPRGIYLKNDFNADGYAPRWRASE